MKNFLIVAAVTLLLPCLAKTDGIKTSQNKLSFTYYLTEGSSCKYSSTSSGITFYSGETGNIYGAASDYSYGTTTCYFRMKLDSGAYKIKFTLQQKDFCSSSDKLEVYDQWSDVFSPDYTFNTYSSTYSSSYTSYSNNILLKFTRSSCSNSLNWIGFKVGYSVDDGSYVPDIIDTVGTILSGAIIAAIVIPIVIVVIIIVSVIGCCVCASRNAGRPGAVITTVAAPPPPGAYPVGSAAPPPAGMAPGYATNYGPPMGGAYSNMGYTTGPANKPPAYGNY